jgi:dihydroneopterin aldolase
MDSPIPNDVVFVNSLQVSLNVGPDCWSISGPQLAYISVYLHLLGSFLNRAGETDRIQESVDYAHLGSAIATLVQEREAPFDGVDGIVEAITKEVFKLTGEVAMEVRVVVDLPKMILLASGFSAEVTTPAGTSSRDAPTKISVKDLILATIIGINPPEREAKQRVITNFVFYEKPGARSPVDYAQIISKISKARIFRPYYLNNGLIFLPQDIEVSSHLTLEKFVMETVRTACLSSDAILAVTVRAEKPSAIPFADSSGVELTRKRTALLAPSNKS